MDLYQSIYRLLEEIGPGRMMSTAYDTAWVARLAELGEPIGERGLEWLRAHQLPDGSWGAAAPRYQHDRMVSTLAAMTALARRREAQDRARLERAQSALETASRGLGSDPAGETIGFEMIVPTLVGEAEALGTIGSRDDNLLIRLTRQREAKLAALPSRMISRSVTAAFSSEMAGEDGAYVLDTKNMQEKNGSVAHSPSATAYFILHVNRQATEALGYLRNIAANPDGGVVDVAPFDVFEQAWTLWNLALTSVIDGELLGRCQPHLDFLQNAWIPQKGTGFAAEYTPSDGDVSSVTYSVLTHFGRTADVETLLSYEESDHFRCYALEANPSTSANIHMLGALGHAGLEAKHPAVQKALQFLRRVQSPQTFWLDKWHASPYYPTAQAIMACGSYDSEMTHDAARWIVETQNPDGSWGYYLPTAEETAYCLQALIFWKRHGGRGPDDVLRRGAEWLSGHAEPPYPPLWIGKCLYCPVLVVRSAVLSALTLVREEL